ncbi:MAG TPA: hypothetical protein VM328_11010 [Fimbriimonadaceae bacterium]|nr:hypothetical protein [Fimbriimonadaceae bacterium]
MDDLRRVKQASHTLLGKHSENDAWGPYVAAAAATAEENSALLDELYHVRRRYNNLLQWSLQHAPGFSPEVTYEWCVMHHNYSDEPHRGPMTEAEAREWVREVEESGDFRKGAFYVARRLVGGWEKGDEADHQ